MPVIDLASSKDQDVLRLLQSHPDVTAAEPGECLLEFNEGEKKRHVLQAETGEPVYGLVELMDNNPMVCANQASIPSPATTMALIALGPILLAGAIARPPILHMNVNPPPEELMFALRALAPLDQLRLITPNEDPTVGQSVEKWVFGKEVPAEGMLAVQASFEVPTSIGLPEMIGIYEERFGRSFYVRRRTGTGHMRPSDELVGKPFALYSVEVARGGISNTAIIEVAADPRGKPGAAGLIHAMNIMAGLEESLGIPV